MKSEADQAYGSLTEGIHIAGYTLERALRKVEWLLADNSRWTSVGGGFEDVNVFFDTVQLDQFKTIAEQRKKIVASIKKLQPKVSNKRIAKAIGVNPSTIDRDVAAFAADGKEETPSQRGGLRQAAAFAAALSGAAAAKTVAGAEARELKEQRREASRAENREKVAHVATANIPIDVKFPTIVIDPPWDWGDEGDQDQLGRARPDYATMTIEQLMDFNMVRDHAAADCHLYMWITNRSLPKGFALLERWGFRYVTMLTWVKPNFGMGNYFRGQTEQILFGVKGSQPLRRKDIGTAFQWSRGPNGHSSKPVEMYEMVETASPGPYLEIFSRHERSDWTSWGENSRAEAA